MQFLYKDIPHNYTLSLQNTIIDHDIYVETAWSSLDMLKVDKRADFNFSIYVRTKTAWSSLDTLKVDKPADFNFSIYVRTETAWSSLDTLKVDKRADFNFSIYVRTETAWSSLDTLKVDKRADFNFSIYVRTETAWSSLDMLKAGNQTVPWKETLLGSSPSAVKHPLTCHLGEFMSIKSVKLLALWDQVLYNCKGQTPPLSSAIKRISMQFWFVLIFYIKQEEIAMRLSLVVHFGSIDFTTRDGVDQLPNNRNCLRYYRTFTQKLMQTNIQIMTICRLVFVRFSCSLQVIIIFFNKILLFWEIICSHPGGEACCYLNWPAITLRFSIVWVAMNRYGGQIDISDWRKTALIWFPKFCSNIFYMGAIMGWGPHICLGVLDSLW